MKVDSFLTKLDNLGHRGVEIRGRFTYVGQHKFGGTVCLWLCGRSQKTWPWKPKTSWGKMSWLHCAIMHVKHWLQQCDQEICLRIARAVRSGKRCEQMWLVLT